jgi:hypothetical protein
MVVDLVSNGNENQESSWGSKDRPARKASNIAAIYGLTDQKPLEPRCLIRV